jgi:hypothetical protein
MKASALQLKNPKDGLPEFPEITFVNRRFKN